MYRAIRLLCATAILLPLASMAADSDQGTLRVGASKISIDPPREMLDGYSGIHDSLYVRTIVLDNGTQRAALIALETSKVPGGESFLNDLSEASGIAREFLFVSSTHDHNTVRVRENLETNAYYHKIREATIQSLAEAGAAMQTAQVGFGEGKAYVNTNRDEFIVGGYHMGYAPERPSDKTVGVVTFRNMAGDPIAVYANYPVHAVVMYRAGTKDGLPEITGDLPGYTSRYVEDHFEGAVAVWTSGAAGDQNPLFMATYNQDHPDVHDTGPAGYAIVDVQSRRLGEEIVRVAESTANTSSEARLWAAQALVSCPGRERKEPRGPDEAPGGYMAPSYIEMVDADPLTIPLQLLMINDIALAGVAAEVFTEIGMHIKEQSVFDRTMVVTVLAPAGAGYIPTDEAYLLPAEKAVSNRLKPGCAEPAIIQSFNDMMQSYLN